MQQLNNLNEVQHLKDQDLKNKPKTIRKTLVKIESKMEMKDEMTLFDSLIKLDAEISNL